MGTVSSTRSLGVRSVCSHLTSAGSEGLCALWAFGENLVPLLIISVPIRWKLRVTMANRHNLWVLQYFILSIVMCTYRHAFETGRCKIGHTSCALVCRQRCRLSLFVLFVVISRTQNGARAGVF